MSKTKEEERQTNGDLSPSCTDEGTPGRGRADVTERHVTQLAREPNDPVQQRSEWKTGRIVSNNLIVTVPFSALPALCCVVLDRWGSFLADTPTLGFSL